MAATKKSQRKKTGRPTKKTEAVLLKLIEAFKYDFTIAEACRYAEVGESNFYTYMDTDPAFRSKIEAARDYVASLAKKNIQKAVHEGSVEDSWKWLEKRQKNIYSNRVEQVDPETKKLEENIDDRIREVQARIADLESKEGESSKNTEVK